MRSDRPILPASVWRPSADTATATATEGLRPIGKTVRPMMLRLASIKRALDAD